MFNQIRQDVFQHFIWYAVLTDCMNWQFTDSDDDCDTAQTDGLSVTFNQSYVNSLNRAERLFLAAHEIQHIVRKHCRQKTIAGEPIDWDRWNRACDYVINLSLVNYGKTLRKKFGYEILSMPKDGLLDKRFANMSEIEVYLILDSENDSDRPDLPQFSPSDDSQGESGESGDSGDGQQGESGDLSESDIDDIILDSISAAQVAGKGDGSEIGLTVKPIEGNANYAQLMNDFVSRDSKTDYSWHAENRRYRRYGLVMPDKFIGIPNVVIYLDFSGSITNDMVAKFIGEVNLLLASKPPKQATLVGFTTICYEIETVQQNQPFIPPTTRKTGGTSFDSVIRDYNSRPERLAIVFTDGYASINEDIQKPMLWLATETIDYLKNADSHLISV